MTDETEAPGEPARRPVPPHPRNGLPRVASGELGGRPSYDWDIVAPQLLNAIAGGDSVAGAARALGVPFSDAYRVLAKDEWNDRFSQALQAGAFARIDRSHDELSQLAEQDAPNKDKVNAVRWKAQHAQWLAERSHAERWGREDRLKVQSVSAVRVIVETPPVTAQLPAAQEVTARVLSTQEARALTEGAAQRVDTTQPVRVEDATQQ